MADLREIGPTFLLLARARMGADRGRRARPHDGFERLETSDLPVGVGRGVAAVEAGEHSWLADKLVFSALRDRLGFKYLTSAATGGAAMGPDTFKFFLAMRVPLRQLYGQTEALGAIPSTAPTTFIMRRSDIRCRGSRLRSGNPIRRGSARSSCGTPI
jgi:long-chain acyl-CoA synthetase